MIYVTGGAGFIGSALVWHLNNEGYEEIVIIDRLGDDDQWENLRNLRFTDFVDKRSFLHRIQEDNLRSEPGVIFHLGACSSTTETDMDYLIENNFNYTKTLARWSLENNVRFIYASSAATYGDGDQGYEDDHGTLANLKPLNPYAFSKYLFDRHALNEGWLDEIVGLKYFNVYGPNEYHKGEMRSVVNKSFPQAVKEGRIKLFKSHRDDIEHGQQKRDFLYVKDAVDMTAFFMDNPNLSGIFNIGTGQAQSFDKLAHSIFEALEKPPEIEYFDMPENVRDNYQYYTEANIEKLREAGYREELYSLDDGIHDYVINYLNSDEPYLNPED